MENVYNGMLAIKKNDRKPFVTTWMNLEIVILTEASQRNTSIISFACGILKKLQMDLCKKNIYNYQCRKQTWLLRVKQRGINWEIGIDICLHMDWERLGLTYTLLSTNR